ncbi:MAG: HEAT repeat domain-containing protein [Anaerolineae bacterium]
MIINDFLEALEHLQSSEQLSMSHLYALSASTRENMRAFAEVWPSIHVERRRHIIENLVDIAEANFRVDFRRIFRHVLDDPDAGVRTMAIDGLWEDEASDLIDRFCLLLDNDLSASVRASAAQALGKYVLQAELEELGHDPAERIRTILQDVFYDESEDIEVRRRAVESIAYHDHADTREMIRTAYDETPHKMQVSAVFAMGRNSDSCWCDTILLELDNPSPEIRFEAARAGGELRIKRAVPALLDLLLDPDREVQEAAIWALGQIGGERARDTLNLLMQAEDPGLAEAAEEAFAELLLMEGDIGLPLYDFDLSENGQIELDEVEELETEDEELNHN